MRLHCFKKHVLSRNFHGSSKRRVNKFVCCKRIWKTQEKSNFDLSKNHEYPSCKEPKFSILILSRALLEKT